MSSKLSAHRHRNSPVEDATSSNAHFAQMLADSGYTYARFLAGSWCAVKRFNFTTAVVVGLDEIGYQRRYCYEHAVEAQAAIAVWDGKGHPSGLWIKCKGAGIDFLNPNFT